MANGYGSGFYENITLGIETTGQAGVDRLEQELIDARAALVAFQNSIAAGGPITAKQLDEAAKLAAAVDKYTEAVKAAKRVMAGLPAQMQATGNAMKGASDAALQLSRGLEDLATGGPIGILNNLPGIARGISTAFGATAPQVKIAETAMSFLGTAAFLVYQNFDRIKSAFGSGNAFGHLPDDVEGLTAKLKELEAIKVKTTIDYRDIDIARDRLARLKEDEQGYDRLHNKKSKAQQEAGERATEAIVEYGGGDDYDKSVDKIAGLAARHTAVAESAQTADLAEKARRLRAAAENPANAMGAASIYGELAEVEKQLKASRSGDQGAHLNTVRKMVGRAGEGYSNDIDWLLNIVRGHGDEAAQAGITEGFVQKLGGASRGRVERDASDKLAKAHDKASQAEVEKAVAESAQETEKRVRDAVQSVRSGVDDALEKGIFDAIKSGSTAERAKGGARAGLIDKLRARGVGGYDLSAVADELLDNAADRAENLIGEGALPKLDTKAKTASDKAKRDHDQAVNQVVNRVQGGYQAEAERSLYDAIKAGGDPTTVGQGEHRDLTKALRDRGDVPAELVDEVATRILDRARDKAINDLDSGQKPSIVGKEQRDAETSAKKSGFLPELEARIAANRRAIQAGTPVARNDRDVHNFEVTGTSYVLPEPELRRRLGNEVGQNLRRSGGDPRQAAGIVDVAAGHVDQTYQRDMAQMGNGVMATQAVVNSTQGHVAQVQNQVGAILGRVAGLEKTNAALAMNAMRNNRHLKATQQSRPSLLTEGDNW